MKYYGPDEIRTHDPYNANVVRSQLRYKPMLYSETSLAQNSRKWKGKIKKREKTFAISVLVLNWKHSAVKQIVNSPWYAGNAVVHSIKSNDEGGRMDEDGNIWRNYAAAEDAGIFADCAVKQF